MSILLCERQPVQPGYTYQFTSVAPARTAECYPHREVDGDICREVMTAVVTFVEKRDGFWYFGYRPVGPDGWRFGRFGANSIHIVGPTRFGIEKCVLVCGPQPKQVARQHWQPEPGNTGYDLMC